MIWLQSVLFSMTAQELKETGQLQAKNLIEAGKKHVAAEDYDKLLEVNGRLHSLLPEKEKDSKEMRHFTGIS